MVLDIFSQVASRLCWHALFACFALVHGSKVLQELLLLLTWKQKFVYLTVFSCLTGSGLWGQQSQQQGPDTLSKHFFLSSGERQGVPSTAERYNLLCVSQICPGPPQGWACPKHVPSKISNGSSLCRGAVTLETSEFFTLSLGSRSRLKVTVLNRTRFSYPLNARPVQAKSQGAHPCPSPFFFSYPEQLQHSRKSS